MNRNDKLLELISQKGKATDAGSSQICTYVRKELRRGKYYACMGLHQALAPDGVDGAWVAVYKGKKMIYEAETGYSTTLPGWNVKLDEMTREKWEKIFS